MYVHVNVFVSVPASIQELTYMALAVYMRSIAHASVCSGNRRVYKCP